MYDGSPNYDDPDYAEELDEDVEEGEERSGTSSNSGCGCIIPLLFLPIVLLKIFFRLH